MCDRPVLILQKKRIKKVLLVPERNYSICEPVENDGHHNINFSLILTHRYFSGKYILVQQQLEFASSYRLLSWIYTRRFSRRIK